MKANEQSLIVVIGIRYNFVQGSSPRGGGGDSHMEQTGMLVGKFEFNP